MSNREAIAAAASSAPGVGTVHPGFRQITRPGEGLVRLDHTDYPTNGFGGVDHWQVLVLLPSDTAAAEAWLEQYQDDLVTAVAEQLVVTSCTPMTVALDARSVPCVVLNGHRER